QPPQRPGQISSCRARATGSFPKLRWPTYESFRQQPVAINVQHRWRTPQVALTGGLPIEAHSCLQALTDCPGVVPAFAHLSHFAEHGMHAAATPCAQGAGEMACGGPKAWTDEMVRKLTRLPASANCESFIEIPRPMACLH